MDASDWQRMLQSGERVRTRFGGLGYWLMLGIATAGVAFFLFVWIQIIVFLVTGHRGGTTPDTTLDRAIFVLSSAVWACFFVWQWSSLLRKGIRFPQTHFDLYDWRGRPRPFEYEWIRALVWQPARFRRVGKRDLHILYAHPGSSERWIDLGAELGWREDFAQAVRDEIIRRCGLTDSRPVPGPAIIGDWERVYFRPGAQDLPKLPA